MPTATPQQAQATGIEARLRDALALWEQKRTEGALLLVLVAAAATARQRFPRGTPSRDDPSKQMGDREAFETYVNDELQNISLIRGLNFEFDGASRSLGWVLYRLYRCSLLHEAELAAEAAFVPDVRPGGFMIVNEAGPPARVVVSETLAVLLADLVCRSRESAGLAPDVRAAFIAYVSDTPPTHAGPWKRVEEFSRHKGKQWLRLSAGYFKR